LYVPNKSYKIKNLKRLTYQSAREGTEQVGTLIYYWLGV
jgi:hypothetical protein